MSLRRILREVTNSKGGHLFLRVLLKGEQRNETIAGRGSGVKRIFMRWKK